MGNFHHVDVYSLKRNYRQEANMSLFSRDESVYV